ncbi:class I SAM-dependent methyltransferase [Actinospica sp.]|uniref:class I SAM-dependent methyltransferase n=1 Tax=Actinospica sp. TaxID=1872142 RepID=UPI002B6BC498|nr:class I SAM-dependent methyltransferase [Actinospica sp.]HWG24729.1 class I SAM-dependent methyltransferase [Actinospica sp.]
MTNGQHHHEHGHTHGHSHGDGGDAMLAELLDLDAEVLGESLSEVAGWVAGHAGPLPAGRVLDLGCGTGTGTFALLRESADAEVQAVDGSEFMLERLRERARALGVEKRVRTVRADLDGAWPDFGTVDVVWTSAFMHHLADPDEALRKLYASLRPGGLLAVIELAGFPRFLPDTLGDGLEGRCQAVVDEWRTQEMPHIGDDWGARLRDAGFVVEEERAFDTELRSPLTEAARRYARASLGRTRERAADRLSSADLALLDALLDPEGPESLARRDDLLVRASRIAWAARRP